MNYKFSFESDIKANTLIIKKLYVDKDTSFSGSQDVTELKDIVSQNNPEKIIFDFTEVERIDSFMIGVLFEFVKSIKGKSIFITNIYPHMKEKLNIVGISKFFEFLPNDDSKLVDLLD